MQTIILHYFCAFNYNLYRHFPQVLFSVFSEYIEKFTMAYWFVSIFSKKCSIFNSYDNKGTNLLYVPGKKHFLLLILFLIYFNMKEKCVENILLILF